MHSYKNFSTTVIILTCSEPHWFGNNIIVITHSFLSVVWLFKEELANSN